MNKHEKEKIYKTLTSETKGLATHFWVLEIMRCMCVDDCAQLIDALEKLPNRFEMTTKERASNFWYLKLRFEPVSSKEKLFNIDSHFSSAYKILNHPIWMLFDGVKPLELAITSKADAILRTQGLHFRIEDLWSDGKKDIILEGLYVLACLNDFDGLFALLVIQSQADIDIDIKHYADFFAFNTFLRLMTLHYTSKYQSAYRLYVNITENLYTDIQYNITEPFEKSTKPMVKFRLGGFGTIDQSLHIVSDVENLKALMHRVMKQSNEQSLSFLHAFLFNALFQDSICELFNELSGRHPPKIKPRFEEVTKDAQALFESL